jgi:hypothetical protein
MPRESLHTTVVLPHPYSPKSTGKVNSANYFALTEF